MHISSFEKAVDRIKSNYLGHQETNIDYNNHIFMANRSSK